jgi:TolB protein
MTRLLLLAALVLAVWAPGRARAQAIIVDVPGSANVPLALPLPVQPAGATPAAQEVWDAVFKDLKMSGFFQMQDPAGYVEKGKGAQPGEFEFESWTLIKTAVLVKTRVLPPSTECDPSGSKMCADLYVYYVPTKQTLAQQRFRGTVQAPRALGHAIANKVIEAVTGNPGIFGTRLAAVSNRTGNKEIYVVGLDGAGAEAVTKNGAINLSPAWSPDGLSMAYTSYKKSNPDLYVKDLATGATRTVSSVRGVNTSADFSPNGKTIALARTIDGDSDIFLIDAMSGQQIRRMTTGGGIDVSPDFTPDGSAIVFASERSGGCQIYSMPVLGGNATRLSFAGDFNVDPVISPDGKRIAYVGRSQGGFDIYVASIDGQRTLRITQDAGDNEDPTWSPDGRYLVFSSTRTGKSELWISTADGRHQTKITEGGGWTQPTWAPGMP